MLLALFLAATSCARQPSAAPSRANFIPDSILIAPTEVSVDQRVPVGEIDGIIVDAYRGTPLSHAIVRVVYADSLQKRSGAISDGGGRFRITGVQRGPATLQFSYIAYRTTTVSVSGDSGLIVRAGLPRVATTSCGLLIRTAPIPAVTVVIRDTQTGIAPTVPVMLRVLDGHYADSATGTASAISSQSYSTDSLLLGAANDRDGKYDVRVTAPGYKSWRARGVRPPVSSCYGVQGRQLPVWLLPTSQSPSR
jgi:carboxypeptidase family protein